MIENDRTMTTGNGIYF